jgi:glutathione synthase/RimK-type ligase-like ATP-grasp enzyme
MRRKKIGILFGMEDGFQWALIDRLNAERSQGIEAEPVKVGAVAQARATGYDLILDRISHDIPFYRAFLKNEVLCGTQVVNDPFWACADDKFFENALATKLGVAVPKTVIQPHKDHPPDTTDRSMRNLVFPLDWESVFAEIGFPAFLKKHAGGGWAHVYPVKNREELFAAYQLTGSLVMMLQEAIEFESYYRCYCIGRQAVRIMPYEPRNEHAKRYQAQHAPLSPELEQRITQDTLTLNRALGYDMNTCEFAVKDGVPVAIDFMNWAPDCNPQSVGEENFKWVVEATAQMLIERLRQPRPELHFPTQLRLDQARRRTP